MEQNHLCNFERGHYGEHSSRYMELGPVVQKMSFKDISYLELWQPLVQRTRTICAIFVEGIMRNDPVKYFEFEPVVQEEMPSKGISFLSGVLAALSFRRV